MKRRRKNPWSGLIAPNESGSARRLARAKRSLTTYPP
jgi:hypothetical protein